MTHTSKSIHLPLNQVMSIPPSPPPPDGVEHIDVHPTTWVVGVVFKGDRYGLDGCLVNDGPTLVTFHGHDGTMYGYYRADTLLPDGDDHFGTAPPPRGLYIDYGQRVGLDAGQYAAALNFITRTILDQTHDEAVDQVNTEWSQTTPSGGACPKWHKTYKHGGDECLGEAGTHCNNWRLVRELYMAGGGKDRYHWFLYKRVESEEGAPYATSDDNGWYEWEGTPYHFRTLTDAKRCVAHLASPQPEPVQELIEAMLDMLVQFEANEQYDQADAEVIARARKAVAAATGGAS